MKYSALIIGLGKIGLEYDEEYSFIENKPESSRKILTHSRAIMCHQGFNLAGGVDVDIDKRKKFERIYGIKSFSSLEKFKQSKINIDFYNFSPYKLQVEVIKNSLKILQPKLILLEKPLSISYAEANTLKSLFFENPHIEIAVNYIRRYLNPTNYWLKRIKSGELGNLIFGNVMYGKGILSNGCHFINLSEYWLGELKFKQYLNIGKPCLDFDKEVSIYLEAIEHNNAPLIIHSCGEKGIRCGEIDLWFEKGRLKWENNDTAIKFFKKESKP